LPRAHAFAFAFVSSILIATAGCGAIDNSPEVAAISSELSALDLDGIPSPAKRIIPTSAEHLYFSTPSTAYVSDEEPYGLRYFTANPGVEFEVSAFEDDGYGQHVPGQRVDFKLQRAVETSNGWQWQVVARGRHVRRSGASSVKYKPGKRSGQGLYLVTAVASSHPASLSINVDCGGQGCATAHQPGEICGGFATTVNKCDDGLFCNYEPGQGMCGYADATGKCAVRPALCNHIYVPVCGCDGKTYGNACSAHAAGVGLLHEGVCDVSVDGQWSTRTSNGGGLEYTLAADGTFVAIERPACAYVQPVCRRKITPAPGTFVVSGDTVTLTYGDSPAHAAGSTTLMFSSEDGADHLVGDDFGQSIDLVRAP
jgi:hypothetical protein